MQCTCAWEYLYVYCCLLLPQHDPVTPARGCPSDLYTHTYVSCSMSYIHEWCGCHDDLAGHYLFKVPT